MWAWWPAPGKQTNDCSSTHIVSTFSGTIASPQGQALFSHLNTVYARYGAMLSS
jgi:hypothetical protein